MITGYDERYIIEFKRDYYLNTKYDLEVQIPHIGRLADHYRKRYRITGHWVDCIKVSVRKKNSIHVRIMRLK